MHNFSPQSNQRRRLSMTSFESQEGRLTCRKIIIMQVIALALISIVMKPDFVDIRLIGADRDPYTEKSHSS